MGVVWKVIPAAAGTRTIAHVVRYVVDGQLLERPPGHEFASRVAYASQPTIVDLETGEVSTKAVAIETQGVQSVRTAAIEMEAVAAMNTRLREPPEQHLVLSWREGERPTPEQAFEAGRMALAALGGAEHQYVMALHVDTDNYHLHIVWNRVHPDSYRAVDLYRDYEKLDRACREIELRQGWTHEVGIHAVENGRIERRPYGHEPSVPLGGRGRDMQAWSDERPFADWVQTAAPDLRALLQTGNPSWEQVHARLAEFDLRLERKGSGLVVVDQNDPTHVAKASQIGRFASKNRLESILGPFRADERTFGPAEVPASSRVLERAENSGSQVTPGAALATSAAVEPELAGYGRYLVESDDRRRALRGAELAADSRLLLDDLFSRSATVTSDEFRRAIAADVATLEQAARIWTGLATLTRAGELIALDAPAEVGEADDREGRDGSVRWTTPAILAREAALRDAIDAFASSPRRGTIDVSGEQFAALHLRSSQAAVAQRIFAGESLVVIEGHAGAGKSYVFARVVDALREHVPERTLIGLAQGGQNAAELELTTGMRAMTIASFTRAVRAGELVLNDRTDLVLDEANLVGTFEMHDVVSLAHDSGARLFVAGDTSQLPSVAAGGSFGMLTERVTTTSLDEVVRQHGWRLEAAELARSGNTIARAIEMYARQDCLHDRKTAFDAIEHAVDLWAARSEPYQSRLLLAFRNDDVDALNLEARDRLRARGSVVDGMTVATKRHGDLELGVGDRILFRANEYAELDVRNGMLGTVVSTQDGLLRVRVDGNGAREVAVDPKRYNDFGYGYALAFYSAEGKTADYTVWYATRADFQASAYVALSRSRGDSDVVIAREEFTFGGGRAGRTQDVRENLAFLLRRERTKDFASSYVRRADVPPLRDAQGAAHERTTRFTMLPENGTATAGIRRRADQRRFEQWFTRDVGADLRIALADPSCSWSRVHAILAANNVAAIQSGRGLIYADVSDERWRSKASSLPLRFHLSELEKTLGQFAPTGAPVGSDVAYAFALRDRRLAAEREDRAHGREADRDDHRHQREADRDERRWSHRKVSEHARQPSDELHARFRATRARRIDHAAAWTRQRGDERDRHGAITQEKRAMRERLLARGYGARAAASIATAWAYEQREALRASIVEERSALRATLDPIPAHSWRQFVDNEAASGSAAAQEMQHNPYAWPKSGLDELHTRDAVESTGTNDDPASPTDTAEKEAGGKRDNADQSAERENAATTSPVIESATPSDPAKREIAGLRYKVYENGDVGYRFNDIQSRVFGGDAFRDRGSKVTIEDNFDRAIKAAVGYAKEKWGETPVTLSVNAEQRDRVVREAEKAGLNIKNPELQRELERARADRGKDIFSKAQGRSTTREPSQERSR